MIGHATSTILGLDLRTIEIWTDIALRYFSCKSRHCVRIEYFWKPRSNPETVYDVDIGEFSRRAVWRAIGLPNLSPKNFKVFHLTQKALSGMALSVSSVTTSPVRYLSTAYRNFS
jgi:hypothetical protein